MLVYQRALGKILDGIEMNRDFNGYTWIETVCARVHEDYMGYRMWLTFSRHDHRPVELCLYLFSRHPPIPDTTTCTEPEPGTHSARPQLPDAHPLVRNFAARKETLHPATSIQVRCGEPLGLKNFNLCNVIIAISVPTNCGVTSCKLEPMIVTRAYQGYQAQILDTANKQQVPHSSELTH